MKGYMEKHQGWSRGRGEYMNKSLCCGFCRKEQVRQGKQALGWLVRMIFMDSGAALSSLVPDPGMIGAGG